MIIRICIITQRQQYQYNINLNQQKMANSHGHVPRNIKFAENSIRNFVQSSSFLNSTSAIKQNQEQYNRQPTIPTIPNVSNYSVKPKGFDYYNRSNLLLTACNVDDIQYITKNIVLFQEDVIFPQRSLTMKNISTRQKSPGQLKSQTQNNFYDPPNKIMNQEKSPKKSKQAEMNEFLFNYRKNQQEKKNKKLQFLQEMEKRINNIEKQATTITEKKQEQYEQINNILNLHSEATSFAKKAEMIGKLNATLYDLKKQQNKPMSPRKITQDMGLLEINAAIEEHHEYNDALLDQVERISRSKSKERVSKGKKQIEKEKEANFRKTGMKKFNMDDKQSQLSKTLKRPMQIPPRPASSKKLTTTWRGK